MSEIPCACHPKRVCPNHLGCGECEYLHVNPLNKHERRKIERIAESARDAGLDRPPDLVQIFIEQIRVAMESM